jgi:Ni/Fe-hydrogenase subunit HybB-like protein
VVPTALLYQARIRRNPAAMYACAVMVIFGFVANRLNVGITGLEAGSGTHYIPKWSEVSITLSLVAVGFAIFRVIGQYFPVFEAHSAEPAPATRETKEADPLSVG